MKGTDSGDSECALRYNTNYWFHTNHGICHDGYRGKAVGDVIRTIQGEGGSGTSGTGGPGLVPTSTGNPPPRSSTTGKDGLRRGRQLLEKGTWRSCGGCYTS